MFWLNTTQFSGLAYAHNKGDITVMELHRLRMPWKKLWDLTSQQLWITQKWFSFCLTSHSIYSHSYSTTNHPHSCCTHWPRSISLWTQPQYPELRIQASGWAYAHVPYVCKANRCALDTLCVIGFRLNYKVGTQRAPSSRSCHDTKCSLLVMRYIAD